MWYPDIMPDVPVKFGDDRWKKVCERARLFSAVTNLKTLTMNFGLCENVLLIET